LVVLPAELSPYHEPIITAEFRGRQPLTTFMKGNPKGQSRRYTQVSSFFHRFISADMGNKGSKDKGEREKQKKAQRTPKEKRKLQKEKRNS
jgi:hypothetical protein